MDEIITILVGASPVLIAVVYLGRKLIDVLDKYVSSIPNERTLSMQDRTRIINLLIEANRRLDVIEGKVLPPYPPSS